MTRFCDDLTEHVTRITNHEMKPMDPLTEEEKESNENQELCHICEKEFCTDNNNKKYKKMMKASDIVIIQGNIDAFNIVNVI